MPVDAARLASLLVTTARPYILEHFERDSCIASTRIALNVCAAFDVPAEPLPVAAMIMNPKFKDMTARIGHVPQTVEERHGWTALGAWAVGIGYGDGEWGKESPDKYNGHLVALIDGTYLVDLALDQAHRPHKNIHLKPLVGQPSAAFLAGTEDFALFDCNGSAVRYERVTRSNKDSYRRSPNWRADHVAIRAVSGSVIRAIRSALQTTPTD